MMEKFTATHQIIDIKNNQEILVAELVGEEEFYDQEEFEDWGGESVGIGNYALDEFDKDLLMVRTAKQDPEFGEVVAWEQSPHLQLKKSVVYHR